MKHIPTFESKKKNESLQTHSQLTYIANKTPIKVVNIRIAQTSWMTALMNMVRAFTSPDKLLINYVSSTTA